MILFNTDLDNTIIFSYKHDIGSSKLCAEIYQGRQVSFVTTKTAQLLKQVSREVVIVPTTTRTMEQYVRIDLGFGTPRYALVCNGGVLIEDGVENDEWYSESMALVADCQSELAAAETLLENDPHRTFEVRNIRSLFVFTKSDDPQQTVKMLEEKLDNNKVDIFYNGVKVYAVPKTLDKGAAVERLRKKLGADCVIAAGDSEFDVPLLNAADHAIAPPDFPERERLTVQPYIPNGEKVFSESVLERVLEIAESYKSTNYNYNVES